MLACAKARALLAKLAMSGGRTLGGAASPTYTARQSQHTDSEAASQRSTGGNTEGLEACSEPAQSCAMHGSSSAANAPAGPDVCAADCDSDVAAGITWLDQHDKKQSAAKPAKLQGRARFDGSGKSQHLEVGTDGPSSGSGKS